MGMTKEEIQVKLGVDVASLNAGLGIADGVAKAWTKKRKTDEEDYSSWWKQELEKRTASDVEAASRRNQARKLLREREESRDAKAREAIEGDTLKKSIEMANNAGAAAGNGFGEQFAQKLIGKVRGLALMNIWAVLIGNLQDRWDQLTKWMADQVFGVSMKEAQGRALEKWRLFWRKLRSDMEAEEAKRNADNLSAKKYEKETALLEQQLAAKRELNDLNEKGWKEDDTKTIEAKLKILAIEEKRIQLAMSDARREQDYQELLKEQINLEQNRTDQLSLKGVIKDKGEAAGEANRVFNTERSKKESAIRPVVESVITQADKDEERRRNAYNLVRMQQGLPLIPQRMPNVKDLVPQINPKATADEVKDLQKTILKLWSEGLNIKAAD